MIAEAKKALRKQKLAQRKGLGQEQQRFNAASAARHLGAFLDDWLMLSEFENPVIASYFPIAGELDPKPALAIAGMMGFKLAMPAIHQPGHALEFRHWKAGDPCIQGAFGTLEPAPSAPPAIPDLLLIPLLAFDASCHRLGYGGGFYDRTLEALRAQKACLAIGYAHRVQYEDTIPVDAFDQPLDHVMCEDGLQSGLGLG